MVSQPKTETDATPECVLVVDDDAAIRLVLADTLRDAGFCVIEARSGTDAVSYLRSGGRVDLIFSDIQMPGSIDGLQLARHVRAAYPAIPVILTSGKYKAEYLDSTKNFVPKPYALDHVLALITQILGLTDNTDK